MKKIQTIVACAAALVLVGVYNLKAADTAKIATKATVRSIHGSVTYQTPSGAWEPLKINMELDAGVNIRTGADSYTDLSINGVTSVARITENTMIAIPEMDRVGAGRDADTETTLDLTTGTVLGNVKKLSANSHYEIKTPHGVAGIRGTDWQVTVGLDGVTTFTSVQGQLIVSAVLNNVPVVKVLRDGESWTPGVGDVVPVPMNVLQQLITDIGNIPKGPTAPPPQPPPPSQTFPTGGSPTGSTGNPTPVVSPSGTP
jgi:hypothetical protein